MLFCLEIDKVPWNLCYAVCGSCSIFQVGRCQLFKFSLNDEGEDDDDGDDDDHDDDHHHDP